MLDCLHIRSDLVLNRYGAMPRLASNGGVALPGLVSQRSVQVLSMLEVSQVEQGCAVPVLDQDDGNCNIRCIPSSLETNACLPISADDPNIHAALNR